MCGIVGIVALPGSPPPDRDRVARGITLLHHRGPDGQGIAEAGPVCFGHARLAIVDVEHGAQPISQADGGVLTYNGEIYNHTALRRELEAEGHRFTTRSDTEVLFAACRQWGAGALARLRGMFAFAFWDAPSDTVILARDRVGKKPLYYTRGPWGIAFASELEVLWRTFGPWPLDADALDEYLAWQYVPAPRTIYRGVNCLPPGHLLAVDCRSGRIDIRPYWSLEFKEDRSLSVAEWDRIIDAKIGEATAIRLMSDVPFGAFLSGGVDSSLVVAHMAELLDSPVETFSIGYRESAYSELPFAEAVAADLRTRHHSQVLDEESLAILPTLVRHYGQPFADSSAIPTWHVSALARRSVKMVLSGDGGDEVFAGYNTYERIVSAAAPQLSGCLGGRLLRRLLGPLLPSTAPDLGVLQARCYGHFQEDERRSLLRGRWREAVADRTGDRGAILGRKDLPLISRLQMCDLATYLPFDILTKVDVAAMANSLEVRAPLLDHELIELAATLPAEQRLAAHADGPAPCWEKKVLLRRLTRGKVPAATVDRPKMGFGLPLGPWLSPRLPAIGARLRQSSLLAELLEPAEVERLIAGHSDAHDLSAKLWNIMVLAEWLEAHPEVLTCASS